MAIKNINLTIAPSKRLKQSESYLIGKHNQLHSIESIDDLVTSSGKIDKSDAKGIEFHIIQLRRYLARILWPAGLYVGVSILDEFILNVAKNGKPDICDTVVKDLQKSGMGQSGFVIYPLIEFGLEVHSIYSSKRETPWRDAQIAFKDAGFALTIQSNGLEAAISAIRKMAKRLDIKGSISTESLIHHARAGNLKWLTQNPLMLIKLSSHTGYPYENQFIYELKARIAAAISVMLYAVMIDDDLLKKDTESSSFINNFQTLDIRHYIVGEKTNAASSPIDVRRIPMNVAPRELAILSDLAIVLSAKQLRTKPAIALQTRIVAKLKKVESGYLEFVNLASSATVHKRVYRRLISAIDWYRQSFSSKIRSRDTTVALAIAFETLLTDFYAPGSAERVARRVGICLAGEEKAFDYQTSVQLVCMARNRIVHMGDDKDRTEIRRAQAAFALCFCEVASRLDKLHKKMIDPIRELLSDAATQEEDDARKELAANHGLD